MVFGLLGESKEPVCSRLRKNFYVVFNKVMCLLTRPLNYNSYLTILTFMTDVKQCVVLSLISYKSYSREEVWHFSNPSKLNDTLKIHKLYR